MKFTDRPKWKRIAVAVICLIGLLTLAGGSLAAYTSQAFQRGVARNRDSETVSFTSNYLQSCAWSQKPDSKSFAGRTVLFSETEKKNNSQLSIDLYVYNYANGNTNLISQKDITYDLSVTFSNGKGNHDNYTVQDSDTVLSSGAQKDKAGSNVITYTIKNKTLRGRAANYHKYTLTFRGDDLDTLKITAIATPQNASTTNNQMLAAIIAPCTGATTQTFRATGEFVDKSEAPTEYMGFNYEISISSGRSDNATIKWNPEIVEIDRFFLVNLGKKDEEIETILKEGSLTLTMNQEDGTDDYLIPFYIKNRDEIPGNWDGMEKLITFTADQTIQGQS